MYKTSFATFFWLQAYNFIKKRHQHWYFPVNIQKILATAFFIGTLLVAAFELWFSIWKKFWKRKQWRYCLFNYRSLQSRPTTTARAFIFLAKFAEFYYHKIFEKRSRWRTKRVRKWTPNALSISITVAFTA